MKKNILFAIIILAVSTTGIFVVLKNTKDKDCDYDNPNKEYRFKNSDTCTRAFISCGEGKKVFNDNCGCGCEIIKKNNIESKDAVKDEQGLMRVEDVIYPK